MRRHCYGKNSHLMVAVFYIYHVTRKDTLLVNILDVRIHSGKYHLHGITSAMALVTEIVIHDILIMQLCVFVILHPDIQVVMALIVDDEEFSEFGITKLVSVYHIAYANPWYMLVHTRTYLVAILLAKISKHLLIHNLGRLRDVAFHIATCHCVYRAQSDNPHVPCV